MNDLAVDQLPHVAWKFSDGVAAKLINVYLKSLFHTDINVVSEDRRPEIAAKLDMLHPPIDRLLMDELCRKDVGGIRRIWKTMTARNWSSLNSDEYERLIKVIRIHTCGKMWMIEQHWPVDR
ncbi:hypothetical protein [Rhizobium leguminosarum]|uniref:hypothetical protein n=1 Tax=Rhizobium leguminosarum TaxID=384 RepID=UPI0014429755|nr:hypothetical protein [Rhizobium leguminosarum]NKK80164.1 hypothetical protein [Rhizobium leguminosarum bv. viciae]